jgi:hypothetical protein
MDDAAQDFALTVHVLVHSRCLIERIEPHDYGVRVGRGSIFRHATYFLCDCVDGGELREVVGPSRQDA